MVNQLRNGIWREVYKGAAIDIYRRNLQKAYLDRMNYLLNEKPGGRSVTPVEISQSDIRSIVRGELLKLQRQLKSAQNRYQDELTRYHVQDAIVRIENTLNP